MITEDYKTNLKEVLPLVHRNTVSEKCGPDLGLAEPTSSAVYHGAISHPQSER